MSLLTPPSSSHRGGKENKSTTPGPSTRRVIWAPKNSIHDISNPLKSLLASSKERTGAVKSILKKTQPTTSATSDEEENKERETTPQPSDPLVNLYYLDHPVQKIIADDASLGDIIEGYNVLATRLRASVANATDADASWPLFQPLRKNVQAFTDAVVRDLGRAFTDPLSLDASPSTQDTPKHSLPSPLKSPSKKKDGMTADQVKYARDLCTVCHSVIKCLSAIFSVPAIYRVFLDKQLREMLTAVLKIPLSDELPTPNARKTWALATWLLQVQRLPASVLERAASRIAQAIQRGIDGELGKEGKKGSVSDGLKAIHDLCAYQPAIFTPAFTPLLPSILGNLLAPTLVLRALACHALGGLALGSVSIPSSSIHTQMANHVASFLLTRPPSGATGVLSPKSLEPAIIRTLRTVLGSTEPTQVAQGPVWGLLVLSSFIILLGSRLVTEHKAGHHIASLLSLGMRSTKSSVRGLTCITWRTVTWAYLQSPLPPLTDDGEDEVDEDAREEAIYNMQCSRKSYLKTMLSVVDCQAGTSTIAALLGDDKYYSSNSDEALTCTIELLCTMTGKAGTTCADAVDVMCKLLSPGTPTEPFSHSLLVPANLFSALPGLLSADFKNLTPAVRPLFEQIPTIDDVRSLTSEEVSKRFVFDGMMLAWHKALICLEMFDEADVPPPFVDVWALLLKGNVDWLEENEDEKARVQFASHAMSILTSILQDVGLNFRPKKSASKPVQTDVPDSDDTIPEMDGPMNCSNGELRMRVVNVLWKAMKKAFKHRGLEQAGHELLACLMRNEKDLIFDFPDEEDSGTDRARRSWVYLCVDVIMNVCDLDALKVFWGYEDGIVRDWSPDYANSIWVDFLQAWSKGEGSWEGMSFILAVPFTKHYSWQITADEYSAWEVYSEWATAKALDHGVDNYVVLDSIASVVSCFYIPGDAPGTALRMIDIMLSNLEGDFRDVPTNLLDLISETMCATYPPEPRNKPVAMWMVRALSNAIEHCPAELCVRFLDLIKDGLCMWLKDECASWTVDQSAYDIVPLYQHIVVRIQGLPESEETLETLSTILAAPFSSELAPAPAPIVESFVDFWKISKYSQMTPPSQGWPSAIQNVLRVVGLMQSSEQALSSPSEPAFVLSGSPRTPVPASCTTTPSRREILSKIPSPQRPHKVFGSFPIVPSTPESPVNRRATLARRAPTTPLSCLRSTEVTRRVFSREEEAEKENVFQTADGAVPVTQRIAEVVAGKKRSFEELQEGTKPSVPVTRVSKLKSAMKPRASKKVKVCDENPSPTRSIASSNESEDERAVEEALAPVFLPFPSSQDEETSPVSLEKPRSRCDHTASVVTTPTAAVRKIDLRKIAPSVRRTVSASEVLSLTGKRKRSVNTDEDDVPVAGSGAPLPPADSRPLKRAYTLPSSDFDVNQTPTPACPLSSDDDPHLGQVTPLHLMSPPLRRNNSFKELLLRNLSPFRLSPASLTPTTSQPTRLSKQLFGDDTDSESELPGSDDSVPSSSPDSSPTKAVVVRQLQRQELGRLFAAS